MCCRVQAVEVVGSGKTQISSSEYGLMTRLEIRLRDSRHHVIRRMCEGANVDVVRMMRLSFGPVLLGKLRAGQHRRLTPKEIKALKRGVSLKTATESTSVRLGRTNGPTKSDRGVAGVSVHRKSLSR